ncbi:olfactory receptor-like protein COR5 [Discoglossus pictus]
MGNQTLELIFTLHGLLDIPNLKLSLFLIFSSTFLMTLTANLLILVLTIIDSHLHTPMYFFLGNLAFLDICCSSVTSPRMLYDLFSTNRTIHLMACITQIFFFIFFVTVEVLLLTVMSYDRYTAICLPLHYVQIMQHKFCAKLATGAWTIGFLSSLTHTLFIKRLTFCGPYVIENFFCDLPRLFQISCTSTFLNILVIFILGGSFGIGSFLITFISYLFIFRTVWIIPSKKGKSKGFSTCVSHLMVVTIFYLTLYITYLRPNTSYKFTEDRLISVFYTIITPLLNPLIYSLRNDVLKAAIGRITFKMCSCASYAKS